MWLINGYICVWSSQKFTYYSSNFLRCQEINIKGNLQHAAVVRWLFHELAPRGAVYITSLSDNLALEEFFQKEPFALRVYRPVLPNKSSFKLLILTLLEQLNTRNLHSYAQLFAEMSTAIHIQAYFSATCGKTPQNSWALAWQTAHCFIVLDHHHGKFVNCIIKLLFCMKYMYFANCGFSKHLYRCT